MCVTHGLIIGLGICFLYNSCYLVIAQYFKKRLSMANGIVALEESTGVFFAGPLLQFFWIRLDGEALTGSWSWLSPLSASWA